MKSEKAKGKTNWNMLRAKRKSVRQTSSKKREEVRTFWADADVVIPGGKTRMTVRFDTDVVDWFKSKGPKYQTRMNLVLRQFVEKQNVEMRFSKEKTQHKFGSSTLLPLSDALPETKLSELSAAEYLHALNSLGEISLQKGDIERASKYFEAVVYHQGQSNQNLLMQQPASQLWYADTGFGWSGRQHIFAAVEKSVLSGR